MDGARARRRQYWWMLLVAALCVPFAGGNLDGAVLNVLSADYDAFYAEAAGMANFGPLYREHSVTAPLSHDPKKHNQKVTPPAAWLNLTIIGEKNFRSKMLLRNDNLYYLASTNRLEKLFFLKGWAGNFVGQGGTEVGFTESYKGLMGEEGKQALKNLPLGREAAKWAAWVMSEYGIDDKIKEEDYKRAWATMTVMGPEAIRLNDVALVFSENLDEETRLNEEQIEFIDTWGPMSVAYYCDGKDKENRKEGPCISTNIKDRMVELNLADKPDRMGQILRVMMRPRWMADDGSYNPHPLGKAQPKKAQRKKGKGGRIGA